MEEKKFQKRETVTFVGNYPSCDKEEKQRLHEINNLRRTGDFILASEIVGISVENAKRAFSRVGSKYHDRVVNALENIIENRIKLIKSNAS